MKHLNLWVLTNSSLLMNALYLILPPHIISWVISVRKSNSLLFHIRPNNFTLIFVIYPHQYQNITNIVHLYQLLIFYYRPVLQWWVIHSYHDHSTYLSYQYLHNVNMTLTNQPIIHIGGNINR